jgi:nucleotide-binding universal stress UspA family protein
VAFKHLLVHLDATARTAERVDLAVALSKRLGARLTGLFAESAQLGSSVVAMRNPARMDEARSAARAAFEARAKDQGVETEWLQIDRGEYGHVVGWTVVACRYADLAIFGQHADADVQVPSDLVEEVLGGSGRPLLVVPSAGHYTDVGRRVVVAWTGSKESARALNDAIPLMQGAQKVVLLSLQLPSEAEGGPPLPDLDIVAHLRAHGIAAQRERSILDELGMVNQVLNRAADTQADLTVMGGYAHHGFPLLHRSRSTREILKTMTTPVLLSR